MPAPDTEPPLAPIADGDVPTVRFLEPDGRFAPSGGAEEYLPYVERLGEEDLRTFYRDMALMRRLDREGEALQRQGQLALWVPSHGQEGAQVGSARAARRQDHLFPSYREHVVGLIRGVDFVDMLKMLRGTTHGGWDPAAHGNFHLYTLVLASQTLHATGYALGIQLDGACASGDPDRDEAVLTYFGDGASSQGDANEALLFASSYRTPQVFLLQNNQWAISVPVSRQSRAPLAARGPGFGMPGVRVDGNDVLASYAVTAHHLEAARAGDGPALIEALTYRIGAHTTADDPTRYRSREEWESWVARDPIVRLRRHLEHEDVAPDFFETVEAEADAAASDARRRILETLPPEPAEMFAHVYAEPHPLLGDQAAWLQRYEESYEGEGA